MAQTTTNKEFRDRRVRQKSNPTTDAPLARWEWTDNNSFDVTFGGTETDGNYVTTIVPVANGVASIPITTARSGGTPATNTDLATQHDADTDTLLAAGNFGDETALVTYIQSVSSSGAVVSFIAQPGAPEFTVTTAAPGAGTLTVLPDDTFPITYDGLGYGPVINGAKTHLDITVIPVNSSNVPLDPNGATCDITVRRMIDRTTTRVSGAAPSTPVGVGNAVTESLHPVGQSYRIEAGGGRYGIALGAVSGTIAGLDRLEVHVREVTA